MGLRLFTDLNCPFCYATEQRLERLGVSQEIEWLGVEHEPDLLVPMTIDDPEIAGELAEEVASVQARAPEVPITVPPGKPNTNAGLLAAATALRLDPVRGAAFRHAMYRAYWQDGLDVSDRAVIDELARASDLPPLETQQEDTVAVATWRLEWERSPLRGVPLLVRDDGETVYGLAELETLERFVS
jgi:predicted DsbA family dithiol-disulfide isomerase